MSSKTFTSAYVIIPKLLDVVLCEVHTVERSNAIQSRCDEKDHFDMKVASTSAFTSLLLIVK
jgi:hypothetical protein